LLPPGEFIMGKFYREIEVSASGVCEDSFLKERAHRYSVV